MARERFEHPKSFLHEGPFVTGRKIHGGEVLEKSDVYASTTGKWEECPCPGLVLANDVETLWVRPDPMP